MNLGLKLDVQNIYFDFDDDQLDIDAKNQLDILSEWLKINDSIKIEHQRNGAKIFGLVSIPTYNHPNWRNVFFKYVPQNFFNMLCS